MAPDLVRRNFAAVAPDVPWCGDVTLIDTGEGPLYLATTEDLFSRRLLGHAMSATTTRPWWRRRYRWRPRPEVATSTG
ncbi:hypothetical protein [Actinomadura madurae]|uniref:hypothetical protein n=1 Tax=Actinomadura madurae TaxID=1993 RepID=UPI00399A7942